MPGVAHPPLARGDFDVVVIGGGINGVAIARECAQAGRRTLLVEQHDFASGTTSRSTRIIHGGLRYLEHGEIGLVRESLRERERLLRERPHLVRPTQFLLAFSDGGRHSALAVRAGLWLYSLLSSRRLTSKHTNERETLERSLDAGRAWSVFSYEDAQCEFPELLAAEWLAEAQAAGATARNHTEVLEIKTAAGAVSGITLRDGFSGGEEFVSAKWIVNATGPWADRMLARSSVQLPHPMVGGVRGSHIVLPKFPGAPDHAVYAEACDGRPIFVLPWNQQVLVGTTEVADHGNPGVTEPSAEEIDYLLRSLPGLIPNCGVGVPDISYAFAGVRPLPYSPGRDFAAISRRHELHDHSEGGARGMISVVGGKLTTAAAVARECAERMGIKARKDSAQARIALIPADGVESSLRQWSRLIAAYAHIPLRSARALAEWHGRCALGIARAAAAEPELRQPLCEHSPHLVAEAVAAIQHGRAATLADLLLRRVPVALSGCWSEECTRQAAQRIGRVFGWREQETEIQIESFEAERSQFLIRPGGARKTSSLAAPEHAA
jgi:glycerol-3-phosphate dehydrogenase